MALIGTQKNCHIFFSGVGFVLLRDLRFVFVFALLGSSWGIQLGFPQVYNSLHYLLTVLADALKIGYNRFI